MYSKASLAQLRDRVDLAALISRHLKMERSGRYFRACCPFHLEKSPSFTVEAGAGHYHCFGCGAHGDAIAFIMQHLHLGFAESVEYLAAEFHVPLEKSDTADDKRSQLFQLTDSLASAYQWALLHSVEGREALDYLFSRGIDLSMIDRFRFGLDLGGDFFQKWMEKERVSRELAESLALLRKGGRSFFEGRITLPIADRMGRVLGFTARKWKKNDPHFEKQPKYINSAETDLFKKSKILFGLHYARRAISKEGRVILVEGQIDALRLIHNGFEATVAAQGTAFGQFQIDELLSLGLKEAILLFDGDSAGQKAASKVGQLFLQAGIEVKVAMLDKGLDPDALVLKEGPLAIRKLVDESVSFTHFLLSFYKEGLSKQQLVAKMVEHIESWQNPIAVYEARKTVAMQLSLPLDLVSVKNNPISSPIAQKPADNPKPEKEKKGKDWLERDLLRLLLALSSKDEGLFLTFTKKFDLALLNHDDHRTFYQLLLEGVKNKDPIDPLTLLTKLDGEMWSSFLDDLLAKRIDVEKAHIALDITWHRLKQRAWRMECQKIHKALADPLLGEEKKVELLALLDHLIKAKPED